MKRIIVIVILLLSSVIYPQLKSLEVKPTENRGSIPVFTEFPDKAGIYFYTKFDNATFHSNYGIYKTYDRGPGNYVIIIEPSRQSIEVRIPGYKTEIIKIQDMHPRDVLFYTVEPMKEEEGIGGVKELAVTVVATPTDAEISIDGKPFRNDRPTIVSIGEHELRVAKVGYNEYKEKIVVNPSQTLFKIKLNEEVLQTLNIKSEPNGASINIDGVEKGKTNKAFFLYPGKYKVRVTLEHYIPRDEEVTVQSSEATTVNYKLTKNIGFLKLSLLPQSAILKINGREVGKEDVKELEVGKYEIEISAINYGTIKKTIDIRLGEISSDKVELEKITGTLRVKTNVSDSEVKINNEKVDIASPIELTPGKYKVEVSKPKYKPIEETIVIQKGDDKTLSFNLQNRVGELRVMVSPIDAECELAESEDYYSKWQGAKVMRDVPIGKYKLKLKAKGYKSLQKIIDISENQITSIDIELEKGSDITDNFVYVEGGTFSMGSNDGESDEKRIHSVTISSFYLSKYEVTVKEYRTYCTATGKSMPSTPDWGWNDNDPIVNVRWNDAKEYCSWAGGRLPTEAEWEYAAKGGNKSRGYTYSGSNNIGDVAWYHDNSNSKTHTVGTKAPNELGLYDMSGNVWEWCNDWYNEKYYETSPSTNPTGPSSGTIRVLRGGSWNIISNYCRSADRDWSNPDDGYNYFGFRVARLK